MNHETATIDAIEYVDQVPEDCTLVTDSQEVEELNRICEGGFGCFFVRTFEGEYRAVYGVYGCVPYNDARVYSVGHYF